MTDDKPPLSDFGMNDSPGDGCPVCDWRGEVAVTHDYDHEYYTHVIERDGELFRGRTCSLRTRPARRSIVDRLGDALRTGIKRLR